MAATYTKPFDYDIYNPNLTRGTSNTTQGSAYFFNKLKKISKEAADLVVKERADTMWFVLRHRFNLKGGYGKYPKWQPNKGEPKVKDVPSFKQWKREVMPSGNIRIYNEAQAEDGFSYPLLLLNGPSGSYHWKTSNKGKQTSTLMSFSKRINSEGFSTQMPQGIQPWLDLQVAVLKDDLNKAIGELT